MKKPKKKVTQRVTSKIDGRQDRFEAVEVAIRNIAQSVNEIRSMVAAPPSNGALAHSVEVSKRLDRLEDATRRANGTLKSLVDMHVKAYEQRLATIEEQYLNDRVLALEAQLSKKKGSKR